MAKYLIIPIFISWVVLNNFLYLDPLQGCFIVVPPSWDFKSNQSQIKVGLVTLKNALPEDYSRICKNISIIDPNLSCGGFEGGCYHPGNPRRISVSTTNTTVSWVAGVIVHETCHSFQDREKRPHIEAECHREDDRVLRSLTTH